MIAVRTWFSQISPYRRGVPSPKAGPVYESDVRLSYRNHKVSNVSSSLDFCWPIRLKFELHWISAPLHIW